ncbi:MAG: hypothetical protein GY928_04080, partial [Colwellia sp.]|nr:hypothetical protein [Colwellia sp.]
GSVKVKNTARHQFVALTIFANSLGYVQNEDEVAEGKLGSCFHYLGGKTKRKVVGFNTMCTWYNTCFMLRFNHGIAQELSTQAVCLEMDVALLVGAINTRLYKQVYMQATKDGRVVVQKHILDFV